MGTCLRPSYTAIVWPTISGVIVDRRDHVLITRRSLVRLSSWIFLLRCSSTKGPFFVDRPIRYLASQSRGRAVAEHRLSDRLTASFSPFHKVLIAQLPLARLRTKRRLPPRADGTRHADWRTALAAAVRVAGRIHRHAPYPGTDPQPARSSSFPQRERVVPQVAHPADRGSAVQTEQPPLAGRQPHMGVVAFLGHHLRRGAGRTYHLTPPFGSHFNVMDHGADRDAAERHRVAGTDLGVRSGQHRILNSQALRREDIPLLAVGVAQQRQARGPVRIVFYRRHFCRHTIFVALEIHDAVVPLVSSAPMAYSDSTLRVAAAGLSHRFDQGSLGLLFGDLIKRRNCCKALSRRDRLELFQSHVHQPPYYPTFESIGSVASIGSIGSTALRFNRINRVNRINRMSVR